MATPLRGRGTSSRGPLIFGAIVVLVVLLFMSTGFYTDVLWFREVGIASVLWTAISAQLATGVAVGLFVGAVVYLNLLIAGRMASAYSFFRIEDAERRDPLDRYRMMLNPYLRWLRLAVGVLLGFLAGLGASSSWQTVVLYLNRVSFGQEDPQFGRDIGFYVFELPLFNLVLDWIWFAIVAALVVSLVAHYFHGSIQPEAGLAGISSGVMAHISVLLGLLALVKALQYYLGTFGLNFSARGVVTGASYTDVNAHLPALRLLAIISIISALLFIANIRFRRISLPLAAVGIWVLTALLAGTVWPAFVQRFSVEPQEASRERPYIERNIAATREAYGLDVESRNFSGAGDLEAEDIEANETLLSNVRVWDPDVLQRVYNQLQAITPFYTFPDVDVDRYEVDGEMRQVLLSGRELSIEDLTAGASWQNQHLIYTHGYGLVASLANESTTTGQPSYLLRDLPGTASRNTPDFELERAGIYYGENYDDSEYSIVNTEQAEIDFQGEGEEATVRSSYEGEGGIPMGGFLRKLAFAVRERDFNIILSDEIQDDSRIMLYKDVRDRVRRAAPFLALDDDPYIAAVDGGLKWILDGYTTSNFYPYSQRHDLGEIIQSAESGALEGQANYLRNSVKVVVDAYDGTLDFYVVDEDDPMIEAWRKTFPDLFTDEEPSQELREHFRYPEDLLLAQSEIYLRYHVTDPLTFYSGNDEWSIAATSSATGTPVTPTYLLISLPGESEEEFVLTRQFTPRERNVMNAILVARSDPENYGELLTLDFPSNSTIQGPSQIRNVINQNEDISQLITLLTNQGSEIAFGSLVNLPIEDSILYVQPLFIEAASGSTQVTEGTTTGGGGIPELQTVILVYKDQVVRGDSFDDALAELFDLAEPEAPAEDGEPTDEQPPEEDPSAPPRLRALVEEAGRVYADAQQALSEGDFQAYGRLIEELGALLEEAEALSGGGQDAGGGGGGQD
ncbi:MAG: UPF0182 family protein [Actinomycetota bacterium]